MKEEIARITADYLKIMSSYTNLLKYLENIDKLNRHINHKLQKLEDYLKLGYHADRYYKKK